MPDRSVALSRFLDLIPEGAGPALFALMMAGELDSAAAGAALAEIDWAARRDAVEELLRALLPVEELVPEVYEKWRAVARDGFAFIGARLSPERLVPKLIEQLTLPETTPVEDRIIAFIRRLPSLQKIGQTIARNRNLNPEFRARLAELEDAIHEVEEDEVRAEIEKQLGQVLAEQRVEVEPGLYAEGSVSAIMRFRRQAPLANEPPFNGVFKVLKPFIPAYFQEDLNLLSELADYFDENQAKYDLGQLNLRTILDNVRELFLRETNFVFERASLTAAGGRFAGVAGLRVPVPIPALSTETITAMTEERSIKVTDAFPDEPERRRELARRLVGGLVALPLFSNEASAPFHADPHAGNLRVDESTGDVVVLDWALTDTLSRDQRRDLFRLFLAFPLRDEEQILETLSNLGQSQSAGERDRLKQEIEAFMDTLPLGTIPGPSRLGDLLESLLRSGVRFDSSFLIFRKMLATLGDIVLQLSPEVSIEGTVAEYALARGLVDSRCAERPKIAFTLPLSLADLFGLGVSAQFLLPRIWAQGLRGLSRAQQSRARAQGALTSGGRL